MGDEIRGFLAKRVRTVTRRVAAKQARASKPLRPVPTDVIRLIAGDREEIVGGMAVSRE